VVTRLRVGLIGAGANTRSRHIPGFRAIEGVTIEAVANRSVESGQRVAAEFGIPRVCSSPAELLAIPGLDAVCIGTWPYRHREFTLAALEAGKHVLCEARMAMDATEAEDMLAASRAHSALVAQLVPAPFDFRLGPTVARMVAEGQLGDILEATVTVLNGSGLDPAAPIHWRDRAEYSGHNVMTFGIFAEVIQRWLGDARRVTASARVNVPARRDPESGRDLRIDVPDSLTAAVELARGARVLYHFSSVASGAPNNGVVLYGTKATLRWSPDDHATWAHHGGEWQPVLPDPGTDRGWQVEADFVDSVRNGTPVRLTNFEDGVRYMRLTSACHESWRTGRAVDIQPL